MLKLRSITLLLFILVNCFANAQRHTAKFIFPDSVISLKKGIYLTKEEFLNNSPSIDCEFEVYTNNSDYIVHHAEKNKYLLKYFGAYGEQVIINLNEVFGFYNGFGVFFNFEGKPYELIEIGAISLIRFDRYYHKSVLSQAVTIQLTGMTVTDVHRVTDALLNLTNGAIVTAQSKHFRTLIRNDVDLYKKYCNDKKVPRKFRNQIYVKEYNKRHPIKITENGIQIISEMAKK